MYKLFLTFRYLTRKKIVIFPILVVWLCVMMMIIVTSIMGGFVEHVRQANRDLLGDIIISNRNPQFGWARYQELQQYLQTQFPQIEASTPTIQAFGLITARGGTLGVQIEGIDPVGRAKVSKFGDTLYEEHIGPLNAVDDLTPALPATGSQLQDYAVKQQTTAQKRFETADAAAANQYAIAMGNTKPTLKDTLNLNGLWGLIILALVEIWILRKKKRTRWRWIGASIAGLLVLSVIGLLVAWPRLFPRALENAEDASHQAQLELTRANRTVRFAATLSATQRFTTRDELLKILAPPGPSFAVAHPETTQPGEDPEQGCYAGSYVLFQRDKRGNFDRDEQPEQMHVKLTVVPMSQRGSIQGISASTRSFVLVDDAYTGVYDVDSTYVYAPFETIQLMANMRNELLKEGDPGWTPPRCSELLIKLKGNVGEEELSRIRAQMEAAVAKFQEAHPDAYFDALDVKTWFEKQEKYLQAVQNEKNMMTFILGLMSLVVVVVIFLIFYMIVRDKTRDIGIIKAVGGAEEGVAGIFFTYGAFIGIVGGLLGVLCGVEFVLHTNQIHEWITRMTGVVIWDRSVYVFDTIPDTVNPHEVALYFVLAVVAGILGAAIPAIVAASQDPVKAVRYE